MVDGGAAVGLLGRGVGKSGSAGVRGPGRGAVDDGLAAGQQGGAGKHTCDRRPRLHSFQGTQNVARVTEVTRGFVRLGPALSEKSGL